MTSQGGGLPSDLVPNVVEDECLLTPAQFGALIGRTVTRAENTELADSGARRSCFYEASDAADAAGGSSGGSAAPGSAAVGRIDVYAPAAASARDLVARIAANTPGGRSLSGVGDGCVVVPGQQGSFELVVASRALLVVLTLQPQAAPAPPADAAWSGAASAMVAALPG